MKSTGKNCNHSYAHLASIAGTFLIGAAAGYLVSRCRSRCAASAAAASTAKRESVAQIEPEPVQKVAPGDEPKLRQFSKKDLMDLFMEQFSKITALLLEDADQQYELPQEFHEYIERMIEYNLVGGKLNRGLAVVESYLTLMGGMVSDWQLERAIVVGWCIEWMQATFLVADDIMDQSKTRRGHDCWYRLPDVGLMACNDYLMLESQLFRVLKFYFAGDNATAQILARHGTSTSTSRPETAGGDNYDDGEIDDEDNLYGELVDLFQNTIYQTEVGQLYDTRSQLPNSEIDLSRFTMDRYKLIVKYKTAFYSFYIAVASSMLLSGYRPQLHRDKQLFHMARDILVDMGIYFQIQDDYLDCYGSPEKLGKIGRDIEEAKCSWLVVKAMESIAKEENETKRAEMEALLQECYGVDDAEKVQRVKELYVELDIEGQYRAYEEKTIQKLERMIGDFEEKYGVGNKHGNKEFNCGVFRDFLAKIAKREK